jgi:deazaflavin-dependent oxidoreductase (nitroreductase family)
MASQHELNQRVVAEFRASGGVVAGPLHGRLLVLLTTTGARSGLPRTTPLRYFADGDRLIVFASNLGAARHPAWFLNLRKQPRVVVERGQERFDAEASVPAGAERAALWERVTAANPFLLEHQARTVRQIPLVVLRRL